MLSIALTSAAIVAHLLHKPLSQALVEPVYLVPTAVPQQQNASNDVDALLTEFEWRLHASLRERAQSLAPRTVDWDKGPEIHARTAIVIDEASQKVLWQLNPDYIQPIASITKLLTALTWLDHQPEHGFFAEHIFDIADNAPEGKELNLPMGEKMTLYNIWRSTLVGSDNDTALALAHASTLSHDEFIAAMNEKARMIGMRRAQFVDPTGLSRRNTAAVEDVARLALYAFAQSDIVDATTMTTHIQETVDSHIRTTVRTTNSLLFDREVVITGGKTGYTEEAGYCVVERFRVPGTARNVIVVVLGASSDAARFAEAKKIALWTFAHHEW